MKFRSKEFLVLEMLLIIGILVIPVLAAPVNLNLCTDDHLSSYVTGCRIRGDSVFVDVYNPGSDTESLEVFFQAKKYDESWYRDITLDCFEINPGERTTVSFALAIPPRSIWQICDCSVMDCGGGGCFIATAAYGTSTAEEIDILRDFRDDVLMQNSLGKELVDFYYAVSPSLANIISEHELLRTFVREIIIDPIVMIINETKDYWRE